MAVTRVQYPPRKTTRQKMREDTKAGKRESSDSIPGRSKDATRAAVDKRRVEREGSYKTRMDDPAPIKPSSMPEPSPATLPSNIRRVEMKAGGKVKKDRRDGIAQRGRTRA
jgi:hypothetical protein